MGFSGMVFQDVSNHDQNMAIREISATLSVWTPIEVWIPSVTSGASPSASLIQDLCEELDHVCLFRQIQICHRTAPNVNTREQHLDLYVPQKLSTHLPHTSRSRTEIQSLLFNLRLLIVCELTLQEGRFDTWKNCHWLGDTICFKNSDMTWRDSATSRRCRQPQTLKFIRVSIL